MLNKFLASKAGATLLGAVLAGIVYFVPDAKPVACGAGFVLPHLL